MDTQDQILLALEAGQQRREERRRFFKLAGTAGATFAGMSLLAACGENDDQGGFTPPTPAPTGVTPAPSTSTLTDNDILNFALNLEYLEANYYLYGTTGSGLATTLTSGTGTQGAATGGRQVTFTDNIVGSGMREIAADELAHVTFLRRTLGTAAIAQPVIDLSVTPTSAFSNAARSAGLIGAGASFDPFANDDNFLLGAFLLSEVGVSAYRGSASLLNNKTVIEASAGILAVEAYHVGLINTSLYRRSIQTPALIANTTAISNARDLLDGATDLDQGLAPTTNGTSATVANLVPTDVNGLVLGRTAAQVLNIAYLTRAAASSGGFFPSGVNGTIKTSANNA